jgi:mannose/fructose/N-acetylgalactosamine-specific phosphotransferase system component IIC
LVQLWPECGIWLLKAAALGAVLAVDGQGAIGVVCSQPLVVGALAGWALGDAGLGLTAGAYLQLVWLYAAPRGRAPGPDPGSGTVAAVLVAFAFAPAAGHGHAHLALALPVGFAVAELGAWTERLRRRINQRLADRAGRGLLEGRRSALGQAQAIGLAVTASRGAVTALLGAGGGLAAGSLCINLFAGMDFGAAFALIPCVGLGSVFVSVFRDGRLGVACFLTGLAAALAMGLELGLP